MKFLNRIFCRTSNQEISPMSSWDTIIEMMYDKYLDAFADEVIKVIYSKDCSMRYVILKSDKEFFTYQFEAIYQFHENEWKGICSHDTSLPAMWEPFRGIGGKSFLDLEELQKAIKLEPEYKQYF